MAKELPEPSPRAVVDARELLGLTTLSDIKVYEIHGRLTGDPYQDEPQEAREPQLELEFAERHSTTFLENRFKLTFTDSESQYVVDLASIFDINEPVELSDEVLAEFAEKVGFMAAFPYMRESVGTTATRLGRPSPVIGLMRPGDFKIAPLPIPEGDAE